MGVKKEVNLDNDILIHTREIIMAGEIDDVFYTKLLKNLCLLQSQSFKPITIYLNSVGGCMSTSSGLYDFIQTLRSNVTIVVLGEASSAASFLLQAADTRQISRNSILMLHEWSTSLDNTTGTNIRSYIKSGDKIFDKWLSIYLEKSNLDKKTLKSKIKNDWFLTAEEAVQWGLADSIYE